jgi:hypothetical protein
MAIPADELKTLILGQEPALAATSLRNLPQLRLGKK